ncbi:HAD-IIIC family phosphatase [Magnetofaba australis]|uniref:Putative FkbH-like protein n=1 Tax=Magnetofaba australis IT-1 TaxID=1434232 RepID=A0A1Y2K8W6_9PROT|nr:HAD-IIIC family phosphatase [Magnetofaba australis]OSM07122.1 putative FkbH-like protein [Magnetofaba australis IT-1]
MTESAPHAAAPFSLLLVSDFNVGSLVGLLNNAPSSRPLQARAAPFGQAIPTLLQLAQSAQPQHDALLAWSRAEAISPAYAALLAGDPGALADLDADVEAFAARLLAARAGASAILVPTWTRPWSERGLGLMDMSAPDGAGAALLRMNARLLERLSGERGVYLLDAARWQAAVGPDAINPRQWYLTKSPFANPLFKLAAQEIANALQALMETPRKLVVVDLDNTLWGGIVGEVGPLNVTLGGHSPVGEAFVDFQRGLLALRRRGALLAICSKNQESVALEAIANHPEMALRPDDFSAWRINWEDKAANIADIAAELNLGLQSVVFLDDSRGERERVRAALPEVLVPDLPESPMLYRRLLDGLHCFDSAQMTAEDRQRSQMYETERQRQAGRAQVGDLSAWLASLEMVVEVAPLNPDNLPRAAQLLNKTNQMNLRTRRMSEAELSAWAAQPQCAMWVFRVADKFGDLGVVALLGVEIEGDTAQVSDFVVSCRAFQRGLEETMLAYALEQLRGRSGATSAVAQCRAEFLPTAKNAPCLEFWTKRSSFAQETERCFTYSLSASLPIPAHVRCRESG